jgi:hypothetical protein
MPHISCIKVITGCAVSASKWHMGVNLFAHHGSVIDFYNSLNKSAIACF